MTSGSNQTIPFCPSIWPLDVPRKHTLTFAVSQAICFPITIATNTILIYSLYKTGQLGTITNKFVLMMNLSDLCMGLIGQPLIVTVFFIKETFRSCILEKVTEYIVFTSANFSWFMLICISIDRYLLIIKLKRYSRFMNSLRMKILVLISLTIANCLAVILLLAPSFEIQVLFNVANLTTMILVSLLYWYIMRKLTIHNMKLKTLTRQSSGQDPSRVSGERPTQMRNGQEQKGGEANLAANDANNQSSTMKTIKLLIIAIFVLYGPYNIASTYWTYYKFGQKVNPSVNLSIFVMWSYTIVLSNASLNACIIIRGNRRTRAYVREMVRCCLSAQSRVLPVKETTLATETQHTVLQTRTTTEKYTFCH